MHTSRWWTQPRGNLSLQEKSWDVDMSESEIRSEEDVTGKPVASSTPMGKTYASSKSDYQGSPKAEGTEWSHNLHMSPATVHHMEVVFSMVRVIYGREHDDPMNDLDVNMAVWGIFLKTTLRAAVHVGQDYHMILRFVKNHLWNTEGLLFHETGKLISEHKEIKSNERLTV